MTDRSLARLAWVLCGVVLAVLATVLLLIWLGWSTLLPKEWMPWRDQIVSLMGIVGAPVLGGLIASRRPRNPYGWLWLCFGLGLALQGLAESYGAYALVVEPASLAAPRTISRLLGLGGPLSLAIAPFLLLLFPTGCLPSPRWRPLARLVAAAGVVVVLLNLIFDRPDQVGRAPLLAVSAAITVIFASIALSALSLVFRYRRASGLERQQLKWVAFATVLLGAYVVASLAGFEHLFGDGLWNLLNAAANTGLYVAVGIAILRHRLYDIDVIINRALVYGSLTAILVLAYFGSVVVLQRTFVLLAGEGSQLTIVASTLAIAALFNPLRRRIQSFVDRRFYRQKYDATRVLSAFSERLRDETDLDTLTEDLISVVGDTVQPAGVSLWLREPDGRPSSDA